MNRIVVALLVLTTGCSWMTSSPPHRYPNGSVQCSTGRGAPVLDVLMTTTFGIGGLAAASESGAAALLPLGIATLYAVSAAHGFKQADQCRRELDNEETFTEQLATPSRLQSEPAEAVVDEPAEPAVPAEIEIDASELEGR